MLSVGHFSDAQIAEVFPANPIREVDFEIRFTPRLRVQAEIWRFQELLVQEYPDVGLESAMLPTGAKVDVTVFQNFSAARVIKVSAQNLVVAFSAYRNFEEFKEEVVAKTSAFCKLFDVPTLTRVGLRYVNEIMLPGQEPESLTRYVKPFFAVSRVPLVAMQQFAMQFTAAADGHMVTARAALLPGPLRIYVLDIDAHTEVITQSSHIPKLLDSFHNIAQHYFLDHVTEEYKNFMRGK